MRRRELFGVFSAAAVLAWPLAVRTQQPNVARIGFLGPASASATASWVEALRTGLRDLGYQEGKNIAFEFRWAEGLGDIRNRPFCTRTRSVNRSSHWQGEAA
jgi:hypothetical protein